MFKYSIRTELTRKYYERRIRTFFDFIEFMVGSPIEYDAIYLQSKQGQFFETETVSLMKICLIEDGRNVTRTKGVLLLMGTEAN